MTDATSAGTIKTQADASRDAPTLCRTWNDAIELAGKDQEDWEKSADKAVKIYRCDRKERRSFNILHSNVETVVPALYNSTPVPDVRTRYGDKDELARQGAQLLERGVSFQLDQYDFDDLMEQVVTDTQTAGRGVARVRWKTYMMIDPTPSPEGGGEEMPEMPPGMGHNNPPQERVVWEESLCEHVNWRNFRHGPVTSWMGMPWVAYRHFLTYDELLKLCDDDEARANKFPLDVEEQSPKPADKSSGSTVRTVFKRCQVWEVWDKLTRRLIFVAPGNLNEPVRIDPDPYGLLEFFDCPKPLQAIKDPDSMTPITPYDIYIEQAEELSTLTDRLSALIRVCRYRGIRASEITELDDLEDLDDGKFTPSSGAMAILGGAKGLNDAIWTVPIDVIVNVIKELVVQREGIKQSIFELTGIADVMRGASDPNETYGAQQIKANWGSLRANRQQRNVARFCRDVFRIKAEIIANKFSPQTLAVINAGPVSPELISLLRDDVRRRYLIDIETDSTVRGDMARMQQNMNGFMTATGQFIQTFVPLIQSGQFPPALAQAAVVVFGAFARQFKLGKTVEDTLAKLEEAAQQYPIGEPKPEDKAKQQEMEQIQKAGAMADIQKTAAEAKVLTFRAQADAQKQQGDAFKQQADVGKMQADVSKQQAMAPIEQAKGIADIKKTIVDTDAARIEAEAVAKTGEAGGPGFTG